MTVGDEVGLTEELYVGMIGRYSAAVEVLTARIALKDRRIAELEEEVKSLTDANTPKKGK